MRCLQKVQPGIIGTHVSSKQKENKKKTRQKRQTEGHEGQITSHTAMMLAAPAACFTVILVSFITLAILNVFIRCFKMYIQCKTALNSASPQHQTSARSRAPELVCPRESALCLVVEHPSSKQPKHLRQRPGQAFANLVAKLTRLEVTAE